jgi:hypothetical protein
MSRVFSISLNEVTFAKLGELRKLYPNMSRNGMIGHIINVTHLADDHIRIDAIIKSQKNMKNFINSNSEIALKYSEWLETLFTTQA